MIETLFKAYEENDHLRNVILPLTLGVKRIVFFSRKPYEEKSYAPAKALYDRYLHTEIRFVVLDEKKERQQVCEIFKEYPDAAVDMSGSRYILLLLFAEAVHHQLPVFYFDAEENIVKEYHRQDYSPLKPFRLSIEEIVSLSGGRIIQHIHSEPDPKERSINNLILKTVESCYKDYDQFISSITTVDRLYQNSKHTSATCHLDKEALDRLKKVPLNKKFQELGLYHLKGNTLTFRSSRIRTLFDVTGSWLESYLFIKLQRSGRFDDVKMSVVIDFSDQGAKYPVTCEIDLLAAKDNHLVFISCKSNKVDNVALNEIALHRLTFGNELSAAAVATAVDLPSRSPAIAAKAEELDVFILDRETLDDGWDRELERLLKEKFAVL